jgi:hypothetical protein
MDSKGQLQYLLDALPGIQRRAWILEDDLDLFPKRLGALFLWRKQILAPEADRAFGWPVHPNGGVGDCALARARLSHQAKGFSLTHGKGDAIHGLDRDGLPLDGTGMTDGKVLFESGKGYDVRGHAVCAHGSSPR